MPWCAAPRRTPNGSGWRLRETRSSSFNHAKWVEFYQRLIEQAAPFPPAFSVAGHREPACPVPAAFPDPLVPSHEATVILTGHDPDERRVRWTPRRRAA